jgi:acetoin utilization deacetylase AcuC-like enzyme
MKGLVSHTEELGVFVKRMPTGYVWEEIYGWHNTGNSAGAAPAGLNAQPYEHFESADSKVRLASAIEVSGLSKNLKRIPAIQASVEDISLVHPKEYIDRIRRDSATPLGGDAGDGLSPFGTGSYEIALWAAGGAIAAIKAVVAGDVANAYALIRPPGHHARVETGMGFCIFANAAIAIRYAQKHLGVKKVVVLDWDVHHGNGTQSIFYEDPNVLTISIHQDGLFPPDSGHVTEQGDGAGDGYALNIPLPAGSGNGAYKKVLQDIAFPAIEKFKPELIVVCCGFDAAMTDPLGRMIVTATGYREMTAALKAVAEKVCSGKIMMTHEGGYSPTYVPFCGLAVIETLAGVETEMKDVLAEFWDNLPDQKLHIWQEDRIQVIKSKLKFFKAVDQAR